MLPFRGVYAVQPDPRLGAFSSFLSAFVTKAGYMRSLAQLANEIGMENLRRITHEGRDAYAIPTQSADQILALINAIEEKAEAQFDALEKGHTTLRRMIEETVQ